MANKWTREKIILPKTLKPKERKQIAEVIISHIINRSAAGLDKNDKKFPKYTSKYAEIKGVGTSEVDLILTGEMLESLELVSEKSGEIVIGYKSPSYELAGKVEGNRIGSYGGDPNPRKARDFLGIDSDTLNTLIDSYKADEELGPVTSEELDALARELAMDMLNDT
ncbi:MAG: hypothetical protein HUM72_12520 [Dolichospermum sp.]|nr:hypothetical protein [Dolichospermum sp.]